MSLYSMPRAEERQGISDLVRQVLTDVSDLIQQHIELTKVELREEAKRLSKATIFGALALVCLPVIMVFAGALLMALLLHAGVSLPLAAAAPFVLFLLIGGILGGLCMQQIKSAQAVLAQATDPLPPYVVSTPAARSL